MTLPLLNVAKRIAIFLVGGIIVFFSLLYELPDNHFHIYFLNVDQGDAIFIKTPQNHQVLIDGGPKNYVLEELTAIMPFFDKSIDLVILTHPHADHVEGLTAVLNHYRVENILFTGVNYSNDAYVEFVKLAREKEIPCYIARKDQDFVFGEVYLDILYPFNSIEGENFSNINNSSIAMNIYYKDIAILLTGDLEIEIEKKLVHSGQKLGANILKAGHHGSKTASHKDFLLLVKPSIVVIQCGLNNRFSHPHHETLKTLYDLNIRSIYRTDLDGRVEFRF